MVTDQWSPANPDAPSGAQPPGGNVPVPQQRFRRFINGARTIGGNQLATIDPSWRIVASGDYNGDGKADILWRENTGAVTMWQMNGTQISGGGQFATVDPVWQVVYTR